MQANRYFLHISMADKRGKRPGGRGGEGRGGKGGEGRGRRGERGGREERKGREGRGEARYAQSLDILLNAHWDRFHLSRN